ncbi:MAG: YbaB/EbfC family nucleoid-associated protein [Oscillospiraceae bacterium]
MKARLPQGYGGGPSNMQGMLKQAQKMQERMTELQEELDAKEYDFTVGGGMLTIHMNGKKEMLGIEIKPEVVDPDDIEMLQDLIVAGVNEAVSSIEKTNAEEMSKVTGNISIPGMF